VLVAVVAVSCGTGGGAAADREIPDGWEEITVAERVDIALPPGATAGAGIPIDSSAGFFDVGDVRVTYDVGPFGEDLDSLAEEADFEIVERTFAGRNGREAAFVPSDEPFGWARVAQADIGGGDTLTMRVSCPSRQDCDIADQIFDTAVVFR